MAQADLRETFTLWDRDGDGKLNKEEFGAVMRTFGGNPTEAEVQGMLDEVGGSIGLQDFQKMMNRVLPNNSQREAEIREAYRVFDKDGLGVLNVAELRFVMTTMGEKMTEKEFEELLREVDVDSEGQIRLEEFVNMILSR